MRDGSEIEALLDSLKAFADEAEGKRAKWGDVWSEIKNIGQAFKETRFPTPQDREAAWKRFQSLVTKVKACQERAKEEGEKRVRESERHLEQIRSYAWKATPSSESADALLAIVTGGLSVLIKAGIEAILGPFDERKTELQGCSKVLKEGWAYLSHNKQEMLGKHKKEAFEALRNASDSLKRAWDTWKTGKQQAIEHYDAERRAAKEAHQAKREQERQRWTDERERIQTEWRSKMQNTLDRKREQAVRLRDSIAHDEGNIGRWRETIYNLRSGGRADEIRDSLESKISDVEAKIRSKQDRLSDLEDAIRDIDRKLHG